MTSNILGDKEFLQTSEFLLKSAVARHASPAELKTLQDMVDLGKRPHTPEEITAVLEAFQKNVAEELARAVKELRQKPTWIPKGYCDIHDYRVPPRPKPTIEKKRCRA
ncbi:MAG: hypothetical protein V1827_06575 [Candidatus Micrarchaeota archaeon]